MHILKNVKDFFIIECFFLVDYSTFFLFFLREAAQNNFSFSHSKWKHFAFFLTKDAGLYHVVVSLRGTSENWAILRNSLQAKGGAYITALKQPWCLMVSPSNWISNWFEHFWKDSLFSMQLLILCAVSIKAGVNPCQDMLCFVGKEAMILKNGSSRSLKCLYFKGFLEFLLVHFPLKFGYARV